MQKAVVAVSLFLHLVASYPSSEQYKGSTVYNVIYDETIDHGVYSELLDTYDVWRSAKKVGDSFVIMVLPEEHGQFVEYTQEHGLTTNVMIQDVGKTILSQSIDNALQRSARNFQSSSSKNFNYNTYHTLDEIESWMRSMASQHSDLLSLIKVSDSYEGRDIYAFKLSSGSGNKPAMWIDGGIHSREWVSPATMMYFVKYFVEGYENDIQVRSLVDRADWYILPLLNVDGYVYTWSSDRLWRKTRSPNPGSSCVGCDPNRNWDQEFGGPGTSSNPCSNTFPGRSAFSEVEVRKVASYVARIPNLKLYLAYHSFGQMYMAPFGHTYVPNPDFSAQMAVCNEGISAIYETHGETYSCDALINLVGPNSGSSADYVYAKLGIKYSFGVELRDLGWYGFLLPENQIQPTAEENFNGLKVMAARILNEN